MNKVLHLVRRPGGAWQLAWSGGPLTREQDLPACVAVAARHGDNGRPRWNPFPLPVMHVVSDDAPGQWDGEVDAAGRWTVAREGGGP